MTRGLTVREKSVTSLASASKVNSVSFGGSTYFLSEVMVVV